METATQSQHDLPSAVSFLRIVTEFGSEDLDPVSPRRRPVLGTRQRSPDRLVQKPPTWSHDRGLGIDLGEPHRHEQTSEQEQQVSSPSLKATSSIASIIHAFRIQQQAAASRTQQSHPQPHLCKRFLFGDLLPRLRALSLSITMSRRKHEEEKDALLLEDMNTDGGSGSSDTTPNSRPSGEDTRRSLDRGSITSVSTTSLVLENLNANAAAEPFVKKSKPSGPRGYRDNDSDPELPRYSGEPSDGYSVSQGGARMSRHLKRIIWIVGLVAAVGWAVALVMFVFQGRWKAGSRGYYDYDHESPMKGSGKKVTLDQIQSGQWVARTASVSWIAGANGEDGLLLEQNARDGFLVVEDIRSRGNGVQALEVKVLMKDANIEWNGQTMHTDGYWVSPDMKRVLVMTEKERVFRHSFTGLYWILEVESQKIQPLDPQRPDERVQLAQWSPQSDSIVFTRDNDLFLRIIGSDAVRQVTDDGGSEYFYGIPDWVYEEEVFGDNKATWWSNDGAYVAFLRTNETMVQEYPVQYFIKRPSGEEPDPGLENYPEVKQIKYPKAGSPNPVSDMLFYDVSRNEMFPVDVEGGYKDNDRLIINVLWADNAKVLIQEANRESDHTRYVLVDMESRTGKTVRSSDLTVDGGWIEPGQKVIYVPADASNGRPKDGYIEITVADDNDHLGYYTPIDNPKPVMLTNGDWEVENGPLAVDQKNNLVYFISTYNGPTQRHVFSTTIDGNGMKPVVPVDKAYWDASFSSLAGYVSLTNFGPGIPYQKIISTPNMPDLEVKLEDNKALAEMARKHELPHNVYSTIEIEGVELQVLERRPPHFDPKKKYPVLFYLYGGPGSQQVSRRFHVDFQSAVASSLNYVVVTVDNRGTGFIGRKARNIIRGQFGKVEAHDQIVAAKAWAQKPYVDADRIAIWGWSYGGFMTLKVLETDAGETFKYGVAVAPVTDWRFYDSIYTERYMRTPQHNPSGYAESAISNVTALGQNVRFMIMHGVADDNVHMQNTLTLLDKLDLAGVDNYDVHFFPDSDHSIYFHNANYMVYERLEKWLINAMNGVWYETGDPRPEEERAGRA